MRTLSIAALALFIASACAEAPDPNITSIASAPTYQDGALLERAWTTPSASTLRPVFGAGPPATGGLTSASMALRSLGDDPGDAAAIMKRRGLGVLGKIPGGLTLDELATHIGADSGRSVHAIRPATLEAFRAALTTEQRMLVNFDRHQLFGIGGGHHSIVGAYLPNEDLVLVLDPDPAYGAFLVDTARLFEATRSVDSSSKQPRGLVVIGARAAQ